MSIDIAIPCGLILNELVSNALKHAFNERETGEIVVELHEDADRGWHLCVRDNGVGLPDGLDKQESLTLGLRLVRMLVAQLQGRLEIRQNEGTEFCLNFPVSAHRPLPNNSSNNIRPV
jgi:two-component sensor histidine kinase